MTGEPDKPLTPEEAAEIERERLESGEAVQAVAQEHAAERKVYDKLIADNPGIDSDEAIDVMKPIFDRMWATYAQQYGQEAADRIVSDPRVLKQIYDQVGGTEKFGPRPPSPAESAFT